MKLHLLVFACLLFVHSNLSAQVSFADSLVRTRLLPSDGLQLGYTTSNFKKEQVQPQKLDPITEEQLEKVLDSLIAYPSKEMELRVGNLYHRMGRMEEANFHMGKARRAYEKELEQTPDSLELMEVIFVIDFGTGNMDSALKYLEEQRRIAPNDTNYYNTKFLIQLFQGKLQDALETARFHLAALPRMATPYFNMTLAKCFMAMQQREMNGLPLDSVTVSLDHLDVIDPETAENEMKAVWIGSKLMELTLSKDWEELLKELEQEDGSATYLGDQEKILLKRLERYTLELKKDKDFQNDYFVYYTLGMISAIQNEKKVAIELLKKAIKAQSYWESSQENPGSAYTSLSGIYLILKNYDAYTQTLEEKIALREYSNPVIEDYLDLACIRILENDETYTEAFEIVEKMAPKSEELLVDQAYLQLLKGDPKEAEKILDKLFAINPDYEELYYALVLLSLKTNDDDTAIFLTERILQFYPEDTLALAVKKHLEH